MLFCSHGNHFEGTSVPLYVAMYFIDKQEMLFIEEQGKRKCGCGRVPTRGSPDSSPPPLSPFRPPLPSPRWGPGVSRTASGENQVEEEMLFALDFLKHIFYLIF